MNRSHLRRASGVIFAGLLVAVALVPQGSWLAAKEKWAHPEASGGPGVAHRAGGIKIKDKGLDIPSGKVFDMGFDSAEPTISILKNGDLYVPAADLDADPAQLDPGNQVDVVMSKDNGKTWTNTSPRIGPQKAHFITLDPYIWLDEWTGRLFTIDLTVACSIMSYSDDGGATWITNPLACGRPVNDHQTLFGGPPATSTMSVYPNVIYYCWNDVASSSCSKSLTGGLTWAPTGTPAFQGIQQGEQGGGELCGGLHGHGVVGEDGTVFLPRKYCGSPYVAISHDEGVTWEQVQIANMKAEGPDPSVAVDKKGNVYYTWVGAKRLPYLAVSKDNGETWGKPMMIGYPGVNEANFATIDVGDPGKVAISYYGTENSPGGKFNEPYIDTTWNAYITTTVDAFGKDPIFYSARLNDPRNPLVRDRCGPGRCKRVFDFIDVEIAPNGQPWAPVVDHCIETVFPNDVAENNCVTKPLGSQSYGDRGLVGTLIGGPPLK
ncbi:MAG TPA: sialidase family protein [Actinomycetota bacterium]|nr:sialidase family protein [Actinomycetota bacterium]